MDRPGRAPEEIDVNRPSAARMYDYYLGGGHNFAIDRAMADQGVAVCPGLPRIMRANRAFLRRAVRLLGEAGIDQFLDIGAGIPTVGNVHEIVAPHRGRRRTADTRSRRCALMRCPRRRGWRRSWACQGCRSFGGWGWCKRSHGVLPPAYACSPDVFARAGWSYRRVAATGTSCEKGPGAVDISLARRLVAEAAGTTILCLFGIGAAVSTAAAGVGPAGLLIVALAHGLALAVAIYAFGSTSGGHFNPTVTLALAVRGRFAWREVPAYVLAQLVGGVLGAALVYTAYASTAVTAGLGATTYAPSVTPVQALVAEAAGAFILVIAVFALAVAPDAPKGVHGLGIGLALATQIMVFGPLTGASVNLARTVGPDVVLSLTGGAVVWSQLLVYLVGPLAGGLLAALLHPAVGKAARRVTGTPAAEQV